MSITNKELAVDLTTAFINARCMNSDPEQNDQRPLDKQIEESGVKGLLELFYNAVKNLPDS